MFDVVCCHLMFTLVVTDGNDSILLVNAGWGISSSGLIALGTPEPKFC